MYFILSLSDCVGSYATAWRERNVEWIAPLSVWNEMRSFCAKSYYACWYLGLRHVHIDQFSLRWSLFSSALKSSRNSFYRAMHFSAKRGIAIACRLSVCPSVRPSVTLVDQDHIGWKSWKLIARTLSPTPSLSVAQRPSTYSQRNMGKFWGD